MNAIRYGNLTAEIVNSAGIRVQRLELRQAATDMLVPRPHAKLTGPLIIGRERQLADALGAIGAGEPVEFHAACGYGKTTLLRHIAATATDGGRACVYLQADRNRVHDLLHCLVTELYRSDQPVKLTADQTAQLLRQVSATVVIDDLAAGPDKTRYVLDTLPRCSVVIGSTRPVVARAGNSSELAGLPAEAALATISHHLGRPIASDELPAARRLAAAVHGQPLHLIQAAALVREGHHSIESLAGKAATNPGILDLLAIDALAEYERRALAVLALAAGALLPPGVVEVTGQLAYIASSLGSLHRRGLAEQRSDRFGLPVCKTESYRRILLEDLHLAISARELARWLTTSNPSASESQAAAEAALAITDFAAEQGEWATVARLAQAAEAALFTAGRWEAWHHVLGEGLDAAEATGDRAAAAFFCHQLGSLALCEDRTDDASRLLSRALILREQIGDGEGASLTRDNLALLEPTKPPRTHRRRGRVLQGVAAAGSALTLAIATIAILAAMRGGPAGHEVVSTGSPSVAQSSATSSPGSQQGSSSPAPSGHGSSATTPSGRGSSATTPSGHGSSSATATATPTQSNEVTVPGLVGDNEKVAIVTLRQDGLAVSTASTTACSAGQNGTVTSQSPGAGAQVSPGSSVDITVCAVSATTSPPTVPDVVGEPESQAAATLNALGLTVTVVPAGTCGAGQAGIVQYQKPAAGQPLPPTHLIALGVCK